MVVFIRSKLFIGWHKSIVSSDWSDTMVWFGQILLYLSFYHPIYMIIAILWHQWLNRKMCSSRKFDPENNLVDLLLLVVHNKSVWYWHPTIFHKVSSEWEASVECQWFLFNFSLKWDFLQLYFTARIKFSWQWMILLEELKSEEWLQLLYQQLLLHNICYIWFVKF